MPYRAAIFDFDGTLLNTLDDLADCMNGILARRGMPTHPVDAYRYFVGDGMLTMAKRAAPADTDPGTAGEMAEEMDAVYADGWAVKTRAYPGIPELLRAYRERGLKLAILSNKPDVFTKEMARYFLPEDLFDLVLGARDGIPKKPDPAAALEIAAGFGIPAAEFLYFGDTNTDMRTGLAAGMFTVGVTWGFRPISELEEAGAQHIISRPEEALALLERVFKNG